MSLIIRYNVYYFDVYGNIKFTNLKKESVSLSEALSLLPFFRTRDLDLVASRHHLADMGSRLRVTIVGQYEWLQGNQFKAQHTLILCLFDLFNNSMY
jgi:hypothetical protein